MPVPQRENRRLTVAFPSEGLGTQLPLYTPHPGVPVLLHHGLAFPDPLWHPCLLSRVSGNSQPLDCRKASRAGAAPLADGDPGGKGIQGNPQPSPA